MHELELLRLRKEEYDRLKQKSPEIAGEISFETFLLWEELRVLVGRIKFVESAVHELNDEVKKQTSTEV